MERISSGASSTSERTLLAALGIFTATSVAGFATFGLHPQLLAGLPPSSTAFYQIAFRFFAVGQVWLAMGVFAFFLIRRTGARWLPAFGVLYLISLTSELMGTTSGIPFGEYSYSPLLNPMWLGHVPVVIPLSWFYMAVPSYALAGLSLPAGATRVRRIALASFLLLAWDLALDPAMSHATRYWMWGGSGPYYGMPWLNLFGWYLTGVFLMGALGVLNADRWIDRLPSGWLSVFYGLNMILAVGMCAAAGLWLAVVLTFVALGGVYALSRASGRIGRPSTDGSDLVVHSGLAR